MVDKKKNLRRKLSQLDENIHLPTYNDLSSTYMMQREPKSAYKNIQNFPTWPFNYRILIAFITSQMVPLLGLTGISEPILNALGALMNFVNQIVK